MWIMEYPFTPDAAKTIYEGLRAKAKSVLVRKNYPCEQDNAAYVYGYLAGKDIVFKIIMKCLGNVSKGKLKNVYRYLDGYTSQNNQQCDYRNPARVFHYGKSRAFQDARMLLSLVVGDIKKHMT